MASRRKRSTPEPSALESGCMLIILVSIGSVLYAMLTVAGYVITEVTR